MTSQEPIFPLRVIFEDGTTVELKDLDHVALYGEFDPWFDSEDEEENRKRGIVKIVDNLGRRVRLVVAHLDVLVCELADC